jgi:hypothetical protein
MDVTTKYFTTHKRGENDEDIQDSVQVNEKKGRYAVSDGVTESFLPRLLADVLTENFVETDGDGLEDIPIAQKFDKKKQEYISPLDEETKMWLESVEETLAYASATFVGLALQERSKTATWTVLGDSCLFVIPEEGITQCICSDQVTVCDDGALHVSFGNTPAQIRSDGKIFGKPIRGEAQIISSGWYVLMTDTISKWFINRLNEKNDVVSVLFGFSGNEEFESFIEKEYQAGRMGSDDCTVVLIRIGENESINNEWDDFPKEECFIPPQRNFVENFFSWTSRTIRRIITFFSE